MITLSQHLLLWARNNAWANHRLYRACAQLPQAQFAATGRTSFFPSIKHTLNHILTVDWYYLDAIERTQRGEPPHPDPRHYWQPEEPFDDCATLQREQARCDARLLAIAGALRDEGLEQMILVPRRSGVEREPLHRLLAHLLQHDIHHRGQVHAMLAGTAVPPPQLDEFFCVNDAPRRAGEMRALGFAE
jgi:uncharacterized damage-inducible protein DinB